MRTLKIIAATAASLALAAAPAPAATGYAWSSPVQLSAAGQHAWSPDVAYSANSSAVIAWGRYDGTQYTAQAVIRNANGTLGPVQTIATSGQVLGGPKVGIDAQGNALLAWSRWDGNDFLVQARTLSAAGVLGLPATLSTWGQDASVPELAVNRDGDGVITWTRYDGDHYQLEARTMSTTGARGGLELISADLVPYAEDMDARDPDVGIDGAGNATFVWQRFDLGLDAIITRTLFEDGTLGPGQSLSYYGGSESPQLAVNENGDVAFTWTHGSTGTTASRGASISHPRRSTASPRSRLPASRRPTPRSRSTAPATRCSPGSAGTEATGASSRPGCPRAATPRRSRPTRPPARARPIRGSRSRRAEPPR